MRLSRKRIYGKSVCDILLAYLSDNLQETNMNTIIDQQLAKIYQQEAIQEAAEIRAERKAQIAQPHKGNRGFTFALAAVAPVMLWIGWMFIKG
jgi:hypothetical protein